MKILLAVHQFFPDFFTGTEVLTLSVAKELIRRGHDVEVFTAYPVPEDIDVSLRFDVYEYDGIPVRRFKHNYTNALPPHNVMESEYRNTFFGEHFSEYLSKNQPDAVHIFHMMRLSGTIVQACHDRRIPAVFTPTDFWAICPTSRLLLPDGSFCEGPDENMVNCLKHIAGISQGGPVGRLVNALPDAAVRTIVNFSARLPEIRYLSLVRALRGRPDFLLPVMKKIDRIIFPTKIVQRKLQEYGIGRDNSVFMPFGMNLDYYKQAPGKKREKNLRVGYVGSLVEHKGPHVLVNAVRKVPGNLPLEVKIYGNPDEFPDYAAKLEFLASGDERIKFCGTFPNHTIGEIFSEIDVLVVPSIWLENTPLVLYSAQASKTPVIGSRLDGISEVIKDGKNGVLFEKGDADALAEILTTLANDRERVDEMAANSAEPLSIAGYVERLEEIYHETRDASN